MVKDLPEQLALQALQKFATIDKNTMKHSGIPGSLVVNFPLLWCTDEKKITAIRKGFDVEAIAETLMH